MDTKLDILNAMLSAVGSSGITSTIGRHPGLIVSAPILNRVNRSIQSKGYWFNTDWKLKLLPSPTNEFLLPQGTLKADASDRREKYVRRGRYMYDPYNHSRSIDIPAMYVDVVIELDYDDLPVAAVDLIRTTAIWNLVQDKDADALAIRTRKDDMDSAMVAFERERLSQSDHSFRDNPNYQAIMHRRGFRNNPQIIGG